MRIAFADSRINGHKEGELYLENTGADIEIDGNLGADLLKKTHTLDGVVVPVFIVARNPVTVGGVPMTETVLSKLKKEVLLEVSEKLGVESVTKDNNKPEIVEKILKFVADAHESGTDIGDQVEAEAEADESAGEKSDKGGEVDEVDETE